MDKKLKAKWVKALLSGKYEQGSGALHRADKYCCLGVLAEIAGIESYSAGFIEDQNYDSLILPANVQSELGRVNDQKVPFEMIAGLIDGAL